MAVRIDDVLHHLVARSAAPSSMGSQLDRLRTGTFGRPDPFRSRDEAENQIMEQAQLLRCMSDFADRLEFRTATSTFRALEKIQKRTNPKLNQGYIALAVLRAYQEWGTQSEARALVAVYAYIRSIAPDSVAPPPKNETDIIQAFRTGKAKRAREFSAEVYADALLALGTFLQTWNKRKQR